MGQPANVYSAYDASGTTGVGKGNREDLVNTVYDISPTETPILSALPRTDASAVLHEWNTHTIAAAAANENIEGDDATIDAETAKTRLNNRCAISRKVAGITGTQEKVSTTGKADAMAEAMGYKMLEIKRDMETMIHANTAKVSGDDSTARKTAGIPTWLKDNVSNVGANPTGDGSDTATNGTQRAFTEDLLLLVSQSCFTNGGKPTILDVGAFNKRQVSGFAGNATRQVMANDQRLVNSVDFYEDDFNKLKVVPNRFQVTRNAVLWDVEYAKVAYLRPFDISELAKTGDSDRKMVLTEWALEVCNPAAHGIVRDLTTS